MSLNAIVESFSNTVLVESGPFPSQVSMRDSRVILLTGANASGKSLVFRLLAELAHNQETPPITLSIRERSGGGTFEMAAMRRSMIYGEESEQSTGATSMSVITRGFGNIRHRLEEGTRSVLMLDEPEMGLSEGYARALGRYLAEQVQALPAEAPGLVVVTHSRPLIQAMTEQLAAEPHFIYMGSEPKTLNEWLAQPEDRSVEDLLQLVELGDAGRRNFSEWFKIQTAARKEKEETAPSEIKPPIKRPRSRH